MNPVWFKLFVDFSEEDFDFDYDGLLRLVDDNEEEDEFGECYEYLDLTSSSSSSLSLEQTSASSTAVAEQQVAKRKRIRNRRRIYAPRIVKRDIRRYYGEMMVNIFNSHDEHAVESFLRTFAVPDMRVRKGTMLQMSTSTLFQQSIRNEMIGDALTGIQWTYIHFLVMKSMFPDQTLRIVSSRLHSRSDTQRTILEVDLRFDFTRMHDAHPLLLTDDIFESIVPSGGSTPQPESATLNSESVQDTTSVASIAIESPSSLDGLKVYADPFLHFLRKAGSEMPRLSIPEPISFIGHMVWHINEKKQLDMFEIVGAEFVQ